MINIAVIDTNVEIENKIFDNYNICICDFLEKKYDPCGHGTAVCGIIAQNAPDSKIDVYPIFENEYSSVEAEVLIETLEYILQEGDYDVVNLSNGIIMSDCIKKLEYVCNRLKSAGVLIISAYDNLPLMTYPACFNSVIGVDGKSNIFKIESYYWIDDSPINILGYSGQRRVAWIDNKPAIVSGNSYLCPQITALAVNYLKENEVSKIESFFRAGAERIISHDSVLLKSPGFVISRAIIFPYNKEMHALIRFMGDLDWEIYGIYDVKYSMNLGNYPKELKIRDYKYKIQNWENINWDAQFDTIIIGHVQILVTMLGEEFIHTIIKTAIKKGKNLYVFDKYLYNIYLQESALSGADSASLCYYPALEIGNLRGNYWGKMWMSSIPVIGVFGTNSKQGKYTLQLELKKSLKDLGYKVAHLSTEPNGWLLGSDSVFHFGYQNDGGYSEKDYVLYLNQLIHEIELKGDYDILITGSQSNSIPYSNFSGTDITVAQTAFLHGTAPDAVILTISPEDDIEYILRTVNHIEAYVNTKVISIVSFPLKRKLQAGGMIGYENIEGTREMNEKIDAIKRVFHGHVALNTHVSEELCEIIVGYLAGEEE